MTEPPAQPTMFDVAAMAGVSQMTVSRVVNGTGRVREPTRRKVDRAIEALRYAPNREARKLAGSKPIRVGCLYSGRFASDLSRFLIGLSSQANLDNVQLLVERCDCAEHEVARLRRLLALRVDGIILTPLADNGGAFALISAAGVPAAAVDCAQAGGRVATVDIDGHAAARLMTRHLIALGHRRIGFVSGPPDEAIGARRLAGYLLALEETGTSRDDRLVVSGKASYRCGLDAAEHLLRLDEPPTAVFAGNDDMAAAVVASAHRLGLDVPGDLTVTGFGDTAVATAIWPELTTIRHPIDQMARAAVHSVASQVRALRRGCRQEPEHLCLEFELVRRQSDAAPRVRPQACLYTTPNGGGKR